MITRKAAIGFILLAIIVFAVSSYDTENPVNKNPGTQPDITIKEPATNNTPLTKDSLYKIPKVRNDTITYRPPLMNFGKWNPYIITAAMELFAFVCYVALKKIEPRIIAWEASERQRLREDRE